MIFVDTGAWYASYVPWDAHSAKATSWTRSNTEELVTTDYVINEVVTLLRARGQGRLAIEAGNDLWASRFAQIEFVTRDDLAHSWELFCRYEDKRWSFTDCTSFVVMKRLGIVTAFAFDVHFRQFGSIAVVP